MKFLLIGTLLVISLSLSSQIRGVNWGDTAEKVLSLEPNKPIQNSDNAIYYKDVIMGIETTVIYLLESGKVTAIFYSFNNEYSDYDLHIADFSKVQKILSNKYGEPIKVFRDVRDLHGFTDGELLRMGYYSISRNYQKDNTILSHKIRLEEKSVVHDIIFSDNSMIDTDQKQSDIEKF